MPCCYFGDQGLLVVGVWILCLAADETVTQPQLQEGTLIVKLCIASVEHALYRRGRNTEWGLQGLWTCSFDWLSWPGELEGRNWKFHKALGQREELAFWCGGCSERSECTTGCCRPLTSAPERERGIVIDILGHQRVPQILIELAAWSNEKEAADTDLLCFPVYRGRSPANTRSWWEAAG